MFKSKSRSYILTSIYFLLIILFCLLGYALTNSLLLASNISDNNITYVSYEILNENIIPVTNTEDDKVSMPYDDENVKIIKNYYDYTQDEEYQIDAIYYYEDTYLQNNGVDYGGLSEFKVNAILDGTVVAVTSDDITGNTVKIKHNNNIIGIYQSLNEVYVKENDYVYQGSCIATSGTNSIGKDLGNHLHFELYLNGVLTNPEEYFNAMQGE